MSRFFSNKLSDINPYVPGEQPKNFDNVVKLNTNESPFSLPYEIMDYVNNARPLNLYSDCDCTELTNELAKLLYVKPCNIVFGNGSDELLNHAFLAFCDDKTPAIFPNISYGFYEVFAQINCLPYTIAKLNDDLTINIKDYISCNKTIFLANPNAWTGIALPLKDIEKIAKSNPNNVVVIDEAYVEFGGKSAVELIDKFDNVLVIQTFSKSRSMAGGRLAFAAGNKELIADLNVIKYSTNPYNVNSLSQAVGLGILKNNDIVRNNIDSIISTREYVVEQLNVIGFETLNSSANFILTKSKKISGEDLYKNLKERGVLVRHSDLPEIKDYVRITIGTKQQMDILLNKIKEII